MQQDGIKGQRDNRMYLISQIFFAVVISTVTGSLSLLAWRLLRKVFMAVNPKLVNVSLRIVCIIYTLPLGYLAVVISEYSWLEGHIRAWKLYFANTKWLTALIQIIAIVWFFIACGVAYLRIAQNVAWCRKLEDNIPIEDETVINVFRDVCQKMGISKGAVSLERNPLMISPMIVNVRHPHILLPEQEYTKEELELILYHELSHYKHHDLKWKVVIVILTAIQGFNPVIYRLLSIVSFWSECMADVSALESSGNVHNAKPYFEKIESLLPDIEVQKKDKYLFASLHGSNKAIVKRVEFVQYYQQAHICSRWTAAITLMSFVFLSVVLAIIAGASIAELHKLIYKATANDSAIQATGIEEYFVDGKEWAMDAYAFTLQRTENFLPDGHIYYIGSTIEPGRYQASESFPIKAGQVIVVSTTIHFYKGDYWVGIQDEEGNTCYVIGKNRAVFHRFYIAKTGWYHIFVKNISVNETISSIAVNCKLRKSIRN